MNVQHMSNFSDAELRNLIALDRKKLHTVDEMAHRVLVYRIRKLMLAMLHAVGSQQRGILVCAGTLTRWPGI